MAPPVISRSEAKAKGLKRYFTSKPCKHGHIAERHTANGICSACILAIETRYRESHRYKFRQKWRNHERNATTDRREATRKAKKKWQDANPEKVAEKGRRWNKANPDRKRAHGKKWRAANPGKVRAKFTPDKVRKYNHTRRSRKLGASGSHTVAELQALLDAQNWQCAGCERSLRGKCSLDHKQPLSRGGSNAIANLQWLCPSCNSRKHDKDYEAWAAEIGLITKEQI